MARNALIGMAIGFLLTYLPFFQMDNGTERVACGMGMSVIAFVILIATEKEPQE